MLDRSVFEFKYQNKCTPYELRQDTVLIPRSRTHYGDQRLCTQIPTLLNQYAGISELLSANPSQLKIKKTLKHMYLMEE